MESDNQTKIDDLTLLKCLGKGSFGEVFLTRKDGKSGLFATKKMDRKYADQPKVAKYLKNEIAILKEINHKNIVKLEDVKITKNHYYLVMEFCNGGSLSECLEKYQEKYGKPFSEEIVQYLMRQIIDGMKYIHNRHIIHRDLKLDNILVHFYDETDRKNLNMMRSTVKIIDFGFATHITKSSLATSTLGSPINMEPHILEKMADNQRGIQSDKKLGYDEKADIWSIGTLCYEMLIGKSAFDSETMNELVKKVESGSYSIPTNVSKEVVSFLNAMLQYNPEKRLSANDLSRHHFLTKNVRDFEPIDVKRVSNKINQNNLKVNIKRNNTIWSIFNEDDEKKLINVPGNYLQTVDNPIREEDEDEYNFPSNPQNKRRNTDKVIPKYNHMINNYPQNDENDHEIMKKNTMNYMGYNNPFNISNPYGNNPGYGYPYQGQQMSNYNPPRFPSNPMPNIIPPSIAANDSMDNYPRGNPMMMGRPQGMFMPSFGVPAPGEDMNKEGGYGDSSGIYETRVPYNNSNNNYGSYASGGGGYGYGYGYGY